MTKYSDAEFINVCMSSKTMKEASVKLEMNFNTFKRKALQLDCYKPNPGGKGTTKPSKVVVDTELILNGEYPAFQTFKLKKRLLKENILQNKCDICGIVEWNGQPLSLELHHKDGVSSNHRLENLQILCPNCHSQTNNFRAKNIKN